MALRPMAEHSRRADRLDQILQARPEIPQPAQSLCDMQDQCGYMNMSWSWKRSLGFPMGAVWGVLRKQWQNRNFLRVMGRQPELPMLILIRTWEDLLSGQAILMGDRIVQLVVGRGLVQTTL